MTVLARCLVLAASVTSGILSVPTVPTAQASGAASSGPEFPVNISTALDQHRPSIATTADDRFVVVWADQQAAGAAPDAMVSGRLVSASGDTEDGQRVLMRRAAGAPHGGYVAPLVAPRPYGGSSFIVASQYEGGAPPFVTEVTTNDVAPVTTAAPTSSGSADGQVDLASLRNGNPVVVTSVAGDVVADLMSPEGDPLVIGVQINPTTNPGSQSEPAVASGDASNTAIVVAYRDRPGAAGTDDITVVRADFGISPVDAQALPLAGVQRDPDVAARSDGSYAIVFVDEHDSADGSGTAIRGRFVGADGTPGPTIALTSTTAGDQTQPAITTLPDGRFFVAWTDASGTEGAGGGGTGVRGRILDVSGTTLAPVGVDQLINVSTASDQYEPAVAALDGGQVGVVWSTASGAFDASRAGVSMRVIDTGEHLNGLIEPLGRICFEVAGVPGDVAVVNLTPVIAQGPGNGQLVSSDVTVPPLASNVNFGAGSVDPNVALARIGTDGRVCYVNSANAATHLVADHLGTIDGSRFEFPAAAGAPVRVVDTRSGLGGAKVAPSGTLCFPVAAPPGGVAVINLTPVEAEGLGNGQLVSSDVTHPPVASNVNFTPGSFDPNVALARVGADGRVCYVNSVHTNVHLVADHLGTILSGVFEFPTAAGAPVRMVDTRVGLGGAKVGPSGRRCFSVSGAPGDVAVVNLTPVEADGLGNGQLISSDVVAPPVASNVNFAPGSFDPNVAFASIGSDGRVCYVNSVHTSVHLVADQLGTIGGTFYTAATDSGAPDRKLDTRPVVLGANPSFFAAELPRAVDCAIGTTSCMALFEDLSTGSGPHAFRTTVGAIGTWSPLRDWGFGVMPYELYDVACTSSSTCITSGQVQAGGVRFAWRTSNGGSDWSFLDGAPLLPTIDCFESGRCYASSFTLVRSDDDGTNWVEMGQPPSGGDGIERVECPSDTVCFGVTHFQSGLVRSTIISSNDGAGTWSISHLIEAQFFRGLACASVLVCTATALDAYEDKTMALYRTLDGGASWTQTVSRSPRSELPVEFECPSASTCLGTTDSSWQADPSYPAMARLLLSRDGGATWKAAVAPTGGPLLAAGVRIEDLTCPSAVHCVIVGTVEDLTGGLLGGYITAIDLP